uniref:Thioredoxin domain-containing protein 17 n=1 Tax=Trichobilharzia regenti TaxID=157069 RepID=A0AA85KH92_TRIRE|nr:unnamed protein product [Trichobilharzia regenti]
MPMEQLLVQSLDELTTQIDTACQKGRRVYLYFSGSTDLTTGDSWSPECCQCEGVLEQAMKGTKEEDLFLMVEIGDQNEWNDANNKYRTHPLYQVKQLPTLLSLSF